MNLIHNLLQLISIFSLTSGCVIDPIPCTNLYVCPKVTEITTCGEGGVDGYTTYQLSVEIQPNTNIQNVYAIFGDLHGNDMYWPPVYQMDGPFNSDIGGVSPSIITIYPEGKYDSWITVGIIDGDPHNKLSTIGVDFNAWNTGKSITTSNGAVFLIDPEEILSEKEYVIAQITLPSDELHRMDVNVQGKTFDSTSAWTEIGISFIIHPMVNTINFPNGCSIWFDGCNLCPIINGQLGMCTEKACSFKETPECRLYGYGDLSGH